MDLHHFFQEQVLGPIFMRKCWRICFSALLRCLRHIPLVEFSIDFPVICMSLIKLVLFWKCWLFSLLFPLETSLLCSETCHGQPDMSILYQCQLHPGRVTKLYLWHNIMLYYLLFQCPVLILFALPLMAAYWYIQHFYRFWDDANIFEIKMLS